MCEDGGAVLALRRPWPVVGGSRAYLPRGPVSAGAPAEQVARRLAAVTAWLAALRSDGISAPVRIGLAGPANVTTLIRFAMRCGVANSIRALTGRADRFMRLVSDSAPDGLIRGLAESPEMEAVEGVAGLHFFPFGGVAKTARWANALRRGRFRLAPSGGMDVEI